MKLELKDITNLETTNPDIYFELHSLFGINIINIDKSFPMFYKELDNKNISVDNYIKYLVSSQITVFDFSKTLNQYFKDELSYVGIKCYFLDNYLNKNFANLMRDSVIYFLCKKKINPNNMSLYDKCQKDNFKTIKDMRDLINKIIKENQSNNKGGEQND